MCAAVLCCVHVHRASFQRRPLFQEHLGMNKLFDQDNVSYDDIMLT